VAAPEPAWVLDTNIVVHVTRGNALGRHLVDTLQLRGRPEVPMISVVTVLVIVDINSKPLLDAYAEIDHWCRQTSFRPGKNDLWIAATAMVSSSELLTADHDFDPMAGKFFTVRYFEPSGTYPSPGTAP
jgi:predicted nucleic acid-binding protein